MSVSDGRLPELFPGEWGWFPSPTVAASSLSHEVCREVMAFFLAHLMGMGGKTRVLPGGQAGRASRCPRAQGCIIRLKDRRVGGGGHLAEPPPPPGTSGFWCLHLIPSPAPCHRHSPRGFGCKPWETRPSQQRPFPMGKKPQAFPDGCSWLLWGKREHPLATGKMSLPCVSAGDDEAI